MKLRIVAVRLVVASLLATGAMTTIATAAPADSVATGDTAGATASEQATRKYLIGVTGMT